MSRSVGENFWQVTTAYDYFESLNISHALAVLRKRGFIFDVRSTWGCRSGWTNSSSVSPSRPQMLRIFQIQTGRVVGVGAQITV